MAWVLSHVQDWGLKKITISSSLENCFLDTAHKRELVVATAVISLWHRRRRREIGGKSRLEEAQSDIWVLSITGENG